jgi:hypothetical protein
MAISDPKTNKSANQSFPIDVWKRLKEIDMFFSGRGKVHQTMRRLARQLREANIPYAILGAMAVNAHGAERTTKDVDFLLTPEGLARFREKYVGKDYDPVRGRPRRFADRQNGVTVDILVTGRFPGTGRTGPFPFPDPMEASEEIRKLRVVTLPQLIQLKLAARRYYDFGDVVQLIKVHQLDESFLEKIHPAVHADFIECLEEKRREDEYESRED